MELQHLPGRGFVLPLPPLTFFEGLRYSHDPRLVWFHVRQTRAAERLVVGLTGTDRAVARRALREIMRDEPFLRELLWRHREFAGREPAGHQFMFLSYAAGSAYFHGFVQYALVRVMRPSVVIETGGTPGNSSAFILQAIDRNQHGELHTVDLPPADTLRHDNGYGGWIHEGMPEGKGSGWAVPDPLRVYHHQHLGNAKELLPRVLEAVGQVDIFIHDSDHSYEHMAWEFSTAWPYLRPGGVLMSDDIDANAAWPEFVTALGLIPHRAGHLGAVEKPAG